MTQQPARGVREADPEAGFETVGTSQRRVDALGKVTGQVEYTADADFDDLAHARLVRSSVAHARIEEVDVSDAMAVEGVIDVVMPEDVPGEPTVGVITPDQPIVNAEKVRYLGDPVGIVVAETESSSRRPRTPPAGVQTAWKSSTTGSRPR